MALLLTRLIEQRKALDDRIISLTRETFPNGTKVAWGTAYRGTVTGVFRDRVRVNPVIGASIWLCPSLLRKEPS